MDGTTTNIASMTGFARAAGHGDGFGWAYEIRSVNGRSLDVKCRVPSGFDEIDATARAEIARRFKRGNISLSLTLDRGDNGSGLRINRPLLDQVMSLARELQEAGAEPPRLDALLSVKGIVETAEQEDLSSRPDVRQALLAGLGELLDALSDSRRAEGARLHDVLLRQLAEIDRLRQEAESSAALQPDALRERLRAQVAALLDAVPALPEERLAQEAALLASRSDVREELDRLRAHVEAARGLIEEGGPVGRQLDFLCQEFNREANTLCSKSSDIELTRIGLSLKVAIEQLREQVQNIE